MGWICSCLGSPINFTLVVTDTICSIRWGSKLFPCPIWQQNRPQGQHGSLFGDLNWERLCTKFPSQTGSLVLLYRWGKPWAVFSVWVPLSPGLVDGIWSLLWVLVRFPGRGSWKLYSTICGTMDEFPCLGRAVEPAPRPISLYLSSLTQSNSTLSSMAKHVYSLALQMISSVYQNIFSSVAGPGSFLVFQVGFLVRWARSYAQQCVGLWINSLAWTD